MKLLAVGLDQSQGGRSRVLEACIIDNDSVYAYSALSLGSAWRLMKELFE